MTDPRTMVITGASSGIGLEMARLAAGRGRALVLVARRGDRLEALAAELRPRVRVDTVVLDLERPDSAEALMAELDRRGVAVETLVNNAGFGLRGGFATLPAGEQAAMVELNVSTLTKLCRLVLPGLVERRRGGIINVGSVAGFVAIPGMAVYAATKAYVLLLSEALHEEARPHGVVVTALCPGSTATEFRLRADRETTRAFGGPAMSAAEVARLGPDGHERGRAVVVTGGANRLTSLALQLAPRALVRRAAGWMQR